MRRSATAAVAVAALLLAPASAVLAAGRQAAPEPPATTAAAAKKDRPTLKLDIPALPKAEVTLEVDARDDDLLGLAKTLNVQGVPVAEALGDVAHLRILTYKWEDGAKPPVVDVTGFFEAAFRKEGARRNLFNRNGGDRVTMLTFDRPRKHFALIFEKGTEVTVARADGYPNLEKLSPLLALFLGGVFGGTTANTPSGQ